MDLFRLLMHPSRQAKTYTTPRRTGNPMANRIIGYVALALIAGCSTGGNIINQPPMPNSPQDSANIRIHRDVADKEVLDDVTFTINEEAVYQFGDTSDFTFVTDPGDYLFGYRQGGKHCSTDVQIDAGGFYVFSLKPGCIIEMEKE
jgi:hypothetical protein